MKPYIAVNLSGGSWHVLVEHWSELKEAYMKGMKGPMVLTDVHGGIIVDRYENIESLWLCDEATLMKIEEEEEEEKKKELIRGN